jgi:dihydroorotate dehydrogenase (fumarate)
VEQAGADAIECNIYSIPTDPTASSEEVEQGYVDIFRAVKHAVNIPVAIKLSPFFTNMAYLARRLDECGADGLVMFNRFYQPDIDLEQLELKPSVTLSTSHDLRLPLTWIGILFSRVKASLAATGGVHTFEDVIKLLMAGANITMLCSVLLKNGVDQLRSLEEELRHWMATHEYESVGQMQGSMSQIRCHDSAAFERAQYMRAVKSLHHVRVGPWDNWQGSGRAWLVE